MKTSFTKSLYRKTAKGERTISVLLVNENGEGQGFRNLPASSVTSDHIKELIGCQILGFYPFQMKFQGKLYDIVCDENGMGKYKVAAFTPHTCDMIGGGNKVDFVDKYDSSRLADLFDLKINGIVPITPFPGEELDYRMPKESYLGTFWAIWHTGPIAFVEANTGWLK